MPLPRNPFRHLKTYLGTTLYFWVFLAGGALFSLITWGWSQPLWVGGVTLVLFVSIAQFLTWREEYEKRLEEEAKNRLPRFKGEIKTRTNPTGYSLDAQKRGKFGTDVEVSLHVRNESPEESTIGEVFITIPEKSGTIHKRRFSLSAPCKRGSPVTLSFLVPVESVLASNLNLDAIKARIIDGHNEDHTISVLHPGSESEIPQTELNEADMQGDIYVDEVKSDGAYSSLRYRCDCSNRGGKGCEINRLMIAICIPGKPGFSHTVRLPENCVKTVMPSREFRCEGHCEIPLPFTPPLQLAECEVASYLVDSVDFVYSKSRTVRLDLLFRSPSDVSGEVL